MRGKAEADAKLAQDVLEEARKRAAQDVQEAESRVQQAQHRAEEVKRGAESKIEEANVAAAAQIEEALAASNPQAAMRSCSAPTPRTGALAAGAILTAHQCSSRKLLLRRFTRLGLV